MKNFSFILFIVLLFFVSCISSEKQAMNEKKVVPFFDTTWELVVLNKEKIMVTHDTKTPFIKFSQTGNKVNGHSGCNGFFGTFESKVKGIKFGPFGMTQMACQGWMDKEFAFIAMLYKATRYEIDGDTLILFNKDDPVAIFTAVTNQ